MNSNPYVEAHRQWDERYANLVCGKRNWQIVTTVFSLLSLILAVGIVWLTTRSRYISYVVEVDKLGYGLTVPRPLIPSTEPGLIERMERYEVASFIRDARLSSDPGAEQHMLDDLLGHARGAANKFLDVYYHSDAPLGAPTHWEAALETRIVPPNSDDSIISQPAGVFRNANQLDRTAELENQPTLREVV